MAAAPSSTRAQALLTRFIGGNYDPSVVGNLTGFTAPQLSAVAEAAIQKRAQELRDDEMQRRAEIEARVNAPGVATIGAEATRLAQQHRQTPAVGSDGLANNGFVSKADVVSQYTRLSENQYQRRAATAERAGSTIYSGLQIRARELRNTVIPEALRNLEAETGNAATRQQIAQLVKLARLAEYRVNPTSKYSERIEQQLKELTDTEYAAVQSMSAELLNGQLHDAGVGVEVDMSSVISPLVDAGRENASIQAVQDRSQARHNQVVADFGISLN